MYRYNRPVSVDDHPWESIGFRIGKPVVGFIEKSVAQSECGVKSSHKEVVIDRNIAVTGHYSAADECVWVEVACPNHSPASLTTPVTVPG